MAHDANAGHARPLDAMALQRVAARLNAASAPPWLHTEVARRMASRLSLIRQQPQRIVNWWSHLGGSAEVLAQACPRSQITEVEPQDRAAASQLAARALPWWSAQRWTARVAPLGDQQVPAASADLLWANMVVHQMADIEGLMRRWRALIADEGFLMFSTLGPGTLDGLRALYRGQGWPSPMAPLVDMHDLGDMLVHAGFAEPVMDQETLTLTWETPAALLQELRTLGANVDLSRARGLRTPRWRERLEAQLEALRGSDGRVRLNFEIVYGHAFCPVPKPRVSSETSVSMEHMRAMVRAGRAAR